MTRRRSAGTRGLGGTALVAVLATAVASALGGCSLLDRDDRGREVNVLELAVGDCLLAPEDITTEITDVRVVECTVPHEQEVFALVPFPLADDAGDDPPFPGDAVLKAFADGACLEAFPGYVGVDYRDSELFFTYLLPSARSWGQGEDRDVTCVITTTGDQRTSSVRQSEL